MESNRQGAFGRESGLPLKLTVGEVKRHAVSKRKGETKNISARWERLEKFDEGDDQTALGDHPTEQPFHKVCLHPRDGGDGFVP